MTRRLLKGCFFLLFFVWSPCLFAQTLPFDHWINRYWELLAPGLPGVSSMHMAWPPGRMELARLLAGEALPDQPRPVPWIENLFRAELHREIRSLQKRDRVPQWDRWRFGVTGWTGERPVTVFRRPSLWIFGEGTIHFSRNLRAYGRVRASHDSLAIPAHTGIPKKVRRLGLNTAEADYAFLEYRNRWLTARFGRYKESWGPGGIRSPWLSALGPAQDGLWVALRYHGFTLRFFSSYLETVTDSTGAEDVHRYLAGHFVTFSDGRRFSVGAGEIMLYSGPNRPLSLTYLNPFMAYQEYENNERTNTYRRKFNRDNWLMAVTWQWYPRPDICTWGIWVIDDIQLDREKIPNATALKLGISYAPGQPIRTLIRFDYIRVSTWTYRHQHPFLNYVSRGLPIGYDGGSDLQDVRLLLVAFPRKYVMVQMSLRYGERGELDIREDPLRLREFPYGWPFPSGVVEKTLEGALSVRFQPRYFCWVEGGIAWRDVKNAGHTAGKHRSSWTGFLSFSTSFQFSFYEP